MYYQYELTHFEGDMGHGVASDASRDDAAADSGQGVSLGLFFWDSRRTC